MSRRWRAPRQPRSRRFEPHLLTSNAPPAAAISHRTRPVAQPRRGRFNFVPSPQVPIPTWIPPLIIPARRATHPALHRSHTAPPPPGNFGPHETLWRLGTPGNGWQFGTPVTS